MRRLFRPSLLVLSSQPSPNGLRLAIVQTLLTMLAASLPPGFATPAGAAAPIQLAEPGASVPVAVGAQPSGGYLIAWQDPESLAIHGQRISPGGFPEPPPIELAPNLPFEVSDLTLSFSTSGRALLAWTQPTGADQTGVGGAILNSDGALVRLFRLPDPIPNPKGLVTSLAPSTASLADGGYAIAWTVGLQEDPLGDPLSPTERDVYAARIDEEGRLVGSAVRVHDQDSRAQVALDIGASETSIVVAWSSEPFTLEQEDFVRVLDLDFVFRSEEIPIEALRGRSLAVAPDGRFAVGSSMMGFGPDDFRARLQLFDPDGNPEGEPFNVSNQGPRTQGIAAVEITGEGTLWVLWSEVHDVDGIPGGRMELALMLRSFSLAGHAISEPKELVRMGNGTFALTGATEGALVTWTPTSSAPFLVGQVVGRSVTSCQVVYEGPLR